MSTATVREARRRADLVRGRLVELQQTVAVAESLTGGLISAYLTAAPGTSVTFRGGLVVYSTDVKRDLAGVDGDLLDRVGAVHAEVARQLALGARERLRTDWGVGVTGVAGPGGQDGRPVGEVFAAVVGPGAESVQRHVLDGTREEIRLGTVITALADLVSALEAVGQGEQ